MNSSDTDFNAVEKIGGSKTHAHSQGSTGGPSNNTSGSTVLTTDQIPAHHHGIHSPFYKFAELNWGFHGDVFKGDMYQDSSFNTSDAGGGKGHTHTLSSHTHTNPNTNSASSLDPYITVYFWKRTA